MEVIEWTDGTINPKFWGYQAKDSGKKKVVKGDLNLTIDVDELHNKVRKEYKKIKKYMNSSIYTFAMMDGNEKIVTDLLKDQEDG